MNNLGSSPNELIDDKDSSETQSQRNRLLAKVLVWDYGFTLVKSAFKLGVYFKNISMMLVGVGHANQSPISLLIYELEKIETKIFDKK